MSSIPPTSSPPLPAPDTSRSQKETGTPPQERFLDVLARTYIDTAQEQNSKIEFNREPK
ncbi:hypothetical protein PFLU3_48010 [Pseudomonas fluorescens]|uniref:Uncharacterized protein n=1 Tax=Pseudomonas fluorescens TaxID=294 RepID=A0A0D0SBX5_PSEFL|nr:hypothetical protein PFLU3_48010 [Pseudomonas fluorescens]